MAALGQLDRVICTDYANTFNLGPAQKSLQNESVLQRFLCRGIANTLVVRRRARGWTQG